MSDFAKLLDRYAHACSMAEYSPNASDDYDWDEAKDKANEARAAVEAYVSGLEAERDSLTHEYLRQISAAHARMARLEESLAAIAAAAESLICDGLLDCKELALVESIRNRALAPHDTPGGE